jgi:uncharacterized protein with ParB-like and HNH nuclease domain
MKYESMTIKKAMQMIEENKLLLPHIQRPFVWKQDRNNNQVKRFFDSIMRGYPFNTLLFWITRDDIQAREFIKNYKANMDVKDTYIKSSEYKDQEKMLVLDGQQRLQTLYIALKGTYDRKEMYFDVLSGTETFLDKQDELKFDFDYFAKDEMRSKNKDENNHRKYWFLLKDIVFSDEGASRIKKKIIKEMEKSMKVKEADEDIVEENVSQLKNLFTSIDLIYYFPIDSTVDEITDYEEILEIFIRANSGGTILSKSDLMFSLIKLNWDEAEEEFENLLDIINKQGAFKFDKDFILKTALVIIDKKAQYKVEKFKGKNGEENLKSIKKQWSQLVQAFKWIKDFLEYANISSDQTLPSYNALIPIIYFAYIHDCKPKSPKTKKNIQTWLYKALLNGNFSGQADRIIDNCTKIIKDNSKVEYFPFSEIENHMRSINRVTGVDSQIIDGNKNLVLNLMYIYNNKKINFQPLLNGNSPEIDHIFPRSKMTRKYRYSTSLVDSIGNYMFLEKNLNIEKTNILPEEYFSEAEAQFADIESDFYEVNCIPKEKSLQKPENFDQFLKERKSLIYNIIKYSLMYSE